MKLYKYWFLVLIFLALAYRIYACFQVPIETTDILRNLGYASHALENYFAIYTTKAVNFKPEIWTAFSTDLGYPYPPSTLLFFHFFSIFGLGIFWVKLVLTLIEGVCAYLAYKRISKIAAVLLFCAPVSLWYTSHEGQFEALQLLFIILNVIAVQDRRWRLAGFLFAVSVQVKQMGILIAPWMLYEMLRKQNTESFPSILRKVIQGIVLGFLPFLGYYIQKPDLLLNPLSIPSLYNYKYNPFAWEFLKKSVFRWNPPLLIYWNAIFTYAPLIILAGVVIFEWTKRKIPGWKKRETLVSVIPLASFWCIVKSLKWAQFWYPIVSPGFMFCFSQRKKLICFLLVLHFMQCLRSTTLILGYHFGYMESQETVTLMESCIFACNLKQTKDIKSEREGISVTQN